MNQTDERSADGLAESLLSALATLSAAEGVALLETRGLASAETTLMLARTALARTEQTPDSATSWLAIATELNSEHADDAANRAWIAYAQARLHLVRGDPPAAEASTRTAQAAWLSMGDAASVARSQLGLTQILAMQGRFDEAAVTIDDAIEQFEELLESVGWNDPTLIFQLAVAHRNRATLFSVQDRHQEALDAFDDAFVTLDALSVNDDDQGVEQSALLAERAHLHLNQAVSFMFLDHIDRADAALQQAITIFGQLGDRLNRGRARTNLGALLVMTGRYAHALDLFDAARDDLLGDDLIDDLLRDGDDAAPLDALNQAGVFLLDQATAYLALNLRPEARAGLIQCEALFRRTGQPYELGQTLYTLGSLHLGDGALAEAAAALDEALIQFVTLDNHYWRNRVQLAQALLAYRRAEYDVAAAALDSLSAAREAGGGVMTLGVDGQVEALLLRLHLALDDGDMDAARAFSVGIEGRLAGFGDADSMPHLRWRLAYAQGRIARAAGDLEGARRHFFAAVDLIESQRISLPLEEVRSAYLDDKADVYAELVATLLDMSDADDIAMDHAFAVVERARSRALLERLLASAPDEPAADPATDARQAKIRSRLHWLYNQLLGDSGDRRAVAATNQAIADHEAALKQLAWRRSPLLAQAEPVTLQQLQRTLGPDEQAVVYFSTPREIMAFVIDGQSTAVVRDLCTPDEVTEALRNWRFQLGRAEIGGDYFIRHRTRLIRGAQGALARLYDLLIAPLADRLTGGRLRFIPHGQLHHTPFHALYDGEQYALQRWESVIAPSASIAVICGQSRNARAQNGGDAYASLAALAISEPGLPNVHIEVQAAAAHFARSRLYIDGEATMAALGRAAAQADVLHIATHGLMRADNPYFSSLKLADGWQDVRALYRLPVAASLVVLSACESGAGQIEGGDEVVGLARGFIGAGAPMVVASLWNVHDASAARLMADFYAALTGADALSPPAALQAAQESAIAGEQHPYYWASFYSIG